MEYSRLLEVLKIGDLNHGKGTSDFTKYFQGIRQDTLGKESALASCEKAGLGKNKDDIVFVFHTPAGSENAKRVNAKTFQMQDNPSNIYTLWICVSECLTALRTIKGQTQSHTPNVDLNIEEPDDSQEQYYDEPEEEESEEDFDRDTEEEEIQEDPEDDPAVSHPKNESRVREGFEITAEDIATLMDVCDVKLWSDSPAFHYQGTNYQLSQMDASLYPTNIRPKHWNAKHKDDNYIDKHLGGLVDSVPSFYGQMAQRLQDLLNKKRIQL